MKKLQKLIEILENLKIEQDKRIIKLINSKICDFKWFDNVNSIKNCKIGFEWNYECERKIFRNYIM